MNFNNNNPLPMVAALLLTSLLVSCSDNNDDDGLFTPAEEILQVDDSNGDVCELLDTRACLLPFPSNFFTTTSSDTDTGLRINFASEAMLKNADGVAVDPTEWNRNDGFSPGSAVVLQVAEIDLESSGAPPLTDIESSMDADAPILVIDADSGERQQIWAELDANAVDADGNVIAEQQSLIIRPAKNYRDGGRYIVALRRLKNAAGDTLAPTDIFRAYRDGITTDSELVENRRAAMEDIFTSLDGAGIARDDLYLAWDFTVASTRNLSERMLHIRDDAFASLGNAAPIFRITSVTDVSATEADWGRRIEGMLTVPNYMNSDTGDPGSRLNYSDDGDELPDRLNGDNTLEQPFVCNIPQISLANAAPPSPPQATRPYIYGHGLLGSRTQANDSEHQAPMANAHDMLNCAVDWLGFAEDDVPTAITILQDGSNFPQLADRMQQGFLGHLFLAEALRHEQGFRQDPAFRVNDLPVYDNSNVYYDGDSQGGIMGAGLMAVANNMEKGVLGVPGMNYSLLLRRSVDFDAFTPLLKQSYPDVLDQTLLLSLFQMLWDRGEANGYANHLTADPLPGTPAKKVLMHVAFGDHQVTHTSAEVMARTIDAAIHQPAAVAGRHHDSNPYFDITPITQYPYDGSAILIWDGGPDPNNAFTDTGTTTPPITNTPPRTGNDPHGRPRRSADVWAQKSAFMQPDGQVIDVCGDEPCFVDGWDGALP